jgi:hypothetical protein
MASSNPEDGDANPPPVHVPGTILPSPPSHTTIATFPPGSFLENLAVRHDGTLLISDMLAGSIWYVDPRAPANSQDTLELVHKFELDECIHSVGAKDDEQEDGGDQHGSYASTPAAEAIVESPTVPDVFYITSGIHGKKGTWWIYEVDMRSFKPNGSSSAGRSAKVTRLAPIPEATWLNGGTAISNTHKSLILMAESYQGILYAYEIDTRKVDIWFEHALFKKITMRPPWPGLNGVLKHGDYVYFTNSDRAVLGRVEVITTGGGAEAPKPGEAEVLATGCCGDDLCIDANGDIYVATNPKDTVLKFPKSGVFRCNEHEQDKAEPDREVMLGFIRGADGAQVVDLETVGPTAVTFADPRHGQGDLYVVTCGGIINPPEGQVQRAKVLRIELASWT